MQFKVYSNRWGHHDEYQFQKTPNGWWIGYLGISGDCDTCGNPILYQNFEHDDISYPNNFAEYLNYLWQKADLNRWNESKIQPKLNALAKWVNHTEYYKPKRGIFGDLITTYSYTQ